VRTSSSIIFSAILLFTPGLASASQPLETAADNATSRYGAAFFAVKHPKTAREMVDLLPGFTFSAGDNTLRGFAAAAGNVLIDSERPSDKQFTLGDLLTRIPADQIDYIEVIRGGRPGVDMLGQTVVANVVRKEGAADSLVATVSDEQLFDGRNLPSATLEATWHLHGGRLLSGAVSASRYVELAEGDGPLSRRDAAGTVLEQMAVASKAGGVNAFGYTSFTSPLWHGQISVNGSVSRTDYTYAETDQPVVGAPTHLDQYLGGPLGGQLHGEIGTNFTRPFGTKWSSESQALVSLKGQSYKSRLTEPASEQLFAEHEHGGEALMRSNLRYAAARDFSLQFSLEGTFNWLHTTNGFQFDGVPILLPNAKATVTEAREQASAQATWTATAKVQIEAALNIEYSLIAAKADVRQHKSLAYLKPRLTLTWSPIPENQIRLRVEREVGQLDFANFVASSSLDTGSLHAGNTDIVPQQSWVFEAAYERHFWSGGDVSLTFRHSEIADAVDRLPITSPTGSVFDAPGNIGAATRDAFIVSLTVPLDRLGIAGGQLKGAGTFQWSHVHDPTTGALRPLTDVNPAEYTVSFRQDLSQWNISWGFNLATPCATSASTKGCAKSEFRFNEVDRFAVQPALGLFVEYRPQPDISLRLEANNVLSQRYDRAVAIYDGPRSTAPLTYSEDRRLTSSPSLLLSLRKTL
jgi:outer membrane receptor protein involved in Fe transport